MKKTLCSLTAALILLLIHAAAYAFTLPNTGETHCYSSYSVINCTNTGQDGEFNFHPMNFTDNGDQTVTDNNTGLSWDKCSMGQSGADCKTGTTTIYISPGKPFSSVCSSRGSGWRTPSKKELTTIVDYSVASPGPAIMASFFPNTQQGFYCTSTPYVGSTDYGWFVYFLDGEVAGGPYSGDSCYLRCVRGTETLQKLYDNGDYTVTDQRTGLMWQQCSAGQTNDPQSKCVGTPTAYGWTNAISYCNTLDFPQGVYTDWRMPNIKELESITDDTDNSRIDTTKFPNTPASAYWSSTTNVDFVDYPQGGYVWGINFNYGSIANWKVGAGNYVRCVRGLGYFVRLLYGDVSGIITLYSTIHDACVAALDGQSIQAQALVSDENAACASTSGIHVWLRGGYDNGFVSNAGFTTVGSLTISGGSITVENLIMQ